MVKRLTANPNHPLDQKLEIRGTASIQTDGSQLVHSQPFLVDLLDPPSDGFKQQQIQPGMLSYKVVLLHMY